MITTPKAGPAASGCRPDWFLGDFIRPAGCCESLVEQFIARLPVVPGMRVLDLGCCSTASTLLNTRAQGCVTRVTVPSTAGHRPNQTPSARAILAASDAQENAVLPYPDADFDLVLNFFGSVFGRRPELAAAEMTRVCKPGGTVALAGWIPLGFVGALFQTLDRHLGAVANRPRARWEDEAGVRTWFGAGIADLRVTRSTARLCFPYPVTETVEHFRRHVVSIHEHFANLRPADHAVLRQELETMFREHNMAGANATELQADVIEVIGRRRVTVRAADEGAVDPQTAGIQTHEFRPACAGRIRGVGEDAAAKPREAPAHVGVEEGGAGLHADAVGSTPKIDHLSDAASEELGSVAIDMYPTFGPDVEDVEDDSQGI